MLSDRNGHSITSEDLPLAVESFMPTSCCVTARRLISLTLKAETTTNLSIRCQVDLPQPTQEDIHTISALRGNLDGPLSNLVSGLSPGTPLRMLWSHGEDIPPRTETPSFTIYVLARVYLAQWLWVSFTRAAPAVAIKVFDG